MGSRLLINMKEAGEEGLSYGTGRASRSTASSIHFAETPGGSDSETSQVENIELGEISALDGIHVEEIHETKKSE